MYLNGVSRLGLILFFVGAFFGGAEIYAMALGTATEAKVAGILPQCAVTDQTTSRSEMLFNGSCDEVPKLQASHPNRNLVVARYVQAQLAFKDREGRDALAWADSGALKRQHIVQGDVLPIVFYQANPIISVRGPVNQDEILRCGLAMLAGAIMFMSRRVLRSA